MTARFSVITILLALLVSNNPNYARAETVLITGSNSGIGLEFARQYAAKGWTVIATHRRDSIPATLKTLSDKYPGRIRVERMDVTDHEEIDALARKLEDVRVDILLNNAGVVFLGDIMDPETRKHQEFGTLDYSQFDTFMHTNTLGPLKIAEAFVDHVKTGDKKLIVNISSAAGTITQPPRYGGAFWYKASKTALNSFMVNLAHELKEEGVIVVMFHPGTGGKT